MTGLKFKVGDKVIIKGNCDLCPKGSHGVLKDNLGYSKYIDKITPIYSNNFPLSLKQSLHKFKKSINKYKNFNKNNKFIKFIFYIN